MCPCARIIGLQGQVPSPCTPLYSVYIRWVFVSLDASVTVVHTCQVGSWHIPNWLPVQPAHQQLGSLSGSLQDTLTHTGCIQCSHVETPERAAQQSKQCQPAMPQQRGNVIYTVRKPAYMLQRKAQTGLHVTKAELMYILLLLINTTAHLHPVSVLCCIPMLCSPQWLCIEPCWHTRTIQLGCCCHHRPDGCVWAHKTAAIALSAVVWGPVWHTVGHCALLH